jgi:hypothetical protein
MEGPEENGDYGAYAEIVAQVKEEFSDALEPRHHTGDEVSYEIAKRWAKRNKRKVEGDKPLTPAEVPRSTDAPTAPGFEEPGNIGARKPGGSLTVKAPDEDAELEDE